MGHGQVLIPHLQLINPETKPHPAPDDFLWTVAKATRAHRSCRHLDPFLPQQTRLMAVS
jgi:hypothetical protein